MSVLLHFITLVMSVSAAVTPWDCDTLKQDWIFFFLSLKSRMLKTSKCWEDCVSVSVFLHFTTDLTRIQSKRFLFWNSPLTTYGYSSVVLEFTANLLRVVSIHIYIERKESWCMHLSECQVVLGPNLALLLNFYKLVLKYKYPLHFTILFC